MIHSVSSGHRLAAFALATFLVVSGGQLSAGLVGDYSFRAECAVEKVQDTVCGVLSKLNHGCLGGERSCDGLGIECYRNQCYQRDCDRRDGSDDYRSGDRKSNKQSLSKTSKSNNSRGSNNSTQFASVTGKGSSLKNVLGGKGSRESDGDDSSRNLSKESSSNSKKNSSDSKKSSSNGKGEGQGIGSILSNLGNRGKNSDKDSDTNSNKAGSSNNSTQQPTTSNSVPKVTSTSVVPKSEPIAVVTSPKPATNAQTNSVQSVIQTVTQQAKPASENKGSSSSSATSTTTSNSSNSGKSNGNSIVSNVLGGSHSTNGFGGSFPIDLGDLNIKNGGLGSLFDNHDWFGDHGWGSHDPFCSSSSKCWKDCGILCDILKCDSKLFDKWLCKTLKWSDICDIIPFPCDYSCGKGWDGFDFCWWKNWFDCHPHGCDWWCCHHHDCDPDPPCPAVPEPGSLTLAGMALVLGAGAGLKRRRRRGEKSQPSETVG